MKTNSILRTLRALGIMAVFSACSNEPAAPGGSDASQLDVEMLSTIEVEEPKPLPEPEAPTKEPVNQCPTPFSLVVAKGVEADDTNEDSWVCDMTTPSGNRVIIDNNIPPEQVGECPEHFTLEKITAETQPKDRNANFLVCMLKSGNGVAVIDDNHKAKN